MRGKEERLVQRRGVERKVDTERSVKRKLDLERGAEREVNRNRGVGENGCPFPWRARGLTKVFLSPF